MTVEDKTGSGNVQAIVLTSLMFGLPAASPGFDWLRIFIPLLPFYFLHSRGQRQTKQIINISLACASLAAILLGNPIAILYAVLLLPAGYSMIQSSAQKRHPSVATGLVTLLIILAWVVGGFSLWMASKVNPYTEMLTVMDKAFVSMIQHYQSQDLAPDLAQDIKYGLEQARQQMPAILPAILLISALLVGWLNMVMGNRLLRKKGFQPPWPAYRYWRVPENSVWLLIVAAAGFILLRTSTIGILFLNMLLVLGAIYVLQGLAVTQAMFERWSVPTLARAFIYAMIAFQTFSVLLLAIIGIIDTWKDLGNIYQDQQS